VERDDVSLAMQVLLGLLPLAPFNTLVVDPALPEWLSEVIVHNLRVGEARVTLRCWREAAGPSRFEVLNKSRHAARRPSATAGIA
jgi:hypothetical protein